MGIEKLNQRFRDLPGDVQVAVTAALAKSGDELADRMRGLAPEDTGDLRASITVTPGGQSTPPHSQPGGSHTVPDNAVAVTAGNSEVRYAHLVEYGTVAAEAQPYFWPAWRLNRDRIRSRITRSARNAIRKGRGASAD